MFGEYLTLIAKGLPGDRNSQKFNAELISS